MNFTTPSRPTHWRDMPNRPSRSLWRPQQAFLLLAVSICVTTGCSSGTDEAAFDAPSASTSTSASTSSSSGTSTPVTSSTLSSPPTTVETPPLVPPSVVASAPAAPRVYEDPVTTEPILVEPPPVAPAPPQVPADPVLPPPSAVDSRGFPLGTTCGPVSCTSPGGLIFVNPDAVPNLESQGFDLCDHTYCPPPGFQLPSTGSGAGGNTTSPR